MSVQKSDAPSRVGADEGKNVSVLAVVAAPAPAKADGWGASLWNRLPE